jgi:hypothetical protein
MLASGPVNNIMPQKNKNNNEIVIPNKYFAHKDNKIGSQKAL